VQPFGSPAEVQFLAHREEIPKVSQFHGD
jgi:hypothetical protein